MRQSRTAIHTGACGKAACNKAASRMRLCRKCQNPHATKPQGATVASACVDGVTCGKAAHAASPVWTALPHATLPQAPVWTRLN